MDGWEGVRTADGSWTLAHPLHGQTCHSRAGAWQGSRERYASACRLRERARPGEELRLLDIGTGLGLNLAAALEALAGTGARLSAWTLERDAGVFTAAAALPPGPPEAERWHAPVRAALVRTAEKGGPLRLDGLPAEAPEHALELVLGDARETLDATGALPFDAIFLDAFSPRVETELWSAEFLARLAARLAPGGLLSTYSVSLPVRRALAAAGLDVGRGPAVGTKSSGTLASRGAPLPPLDARTARRLERARHPPG
ncbi:MAG TPA: MnmC family methyltransferase [Planctomycetota bacterium]|nr:MnmC family methyltransferase [Planctomycetota bacterium]